MRGSPLLSSAFLAVILGAQAALGILYLRKVSVFNAPDEPAHLYYVACLSKTGRLPVSDWPRKPWTREAIQPPLYYLAAAPLYHLLEEKPLEERVRFLRLQNLFFSLVGVCLVFTLGRRVLGEGSGLLCAAFAAFLPQYLFITASVTNDALAAMISTAICLFALESLAPAPSRQPWLLGIAAGLGLLTKATVWGPLLGWAAFLVSDRSPNSREKTRLPAKVLGIALLFFGWFYLRNYFLYGDFIGYHSITDYDSPMRWRELPEWLLRFFESFWGYFAWMASPLPGFAYVLLAAITGMGIAGFTLWILEDRSHLTSAWKLMLSVTGSTAFLAFWHGFLHTRQPQGRFLFPAIGPLSLIFVAGLAYWWRKLPANFQKPAAAAALLALIGLQILSYRAL